MLLVQYQGHWVSVDSRLPAALAYKALEQGALPAWAGYTQVRREAVYGDSRIDLALRNGGRRALIETKSVNLVEDGVALFPDAPTTRGQRHSPHTYAGHSSEGHRRGRAVRLSSVRTPALSIHTTPPTPSSATGCGKRPKPACW